MDLLDLIPLKELPSLSPKKPHTKSVTPKANQNPGPTNKELNERMQAIKAKMQGKPNHRCDRCRETIIERGIAATNFCQSCDRENNPYYYPSEWRRCRGMLTTPAIMTALVETLREAIDPHCDWSVEGNAHTNYIYLHLSHENFHDHQCAPIIMEAFNEITSKLTDMEPMTIKITKADIRDHKDGHEWTWNVYGLPHF